MAILSKHSHVIRDDMNGIVHACLGNLHVSGFGYCLQLAPATPKNSPRNIIKKFHMATMTPGKLNTLNYQNARLALPPLCDTSLWFLLFGRCVPKCFMVSSSGHPIYMTGRIVLWHVHVSTLRRTQSTQKLISAGLASGGTITLEYT